MRSSESTMKRVLTGNVGAARLFTLVCAIALIATALNTTPGHAEDGGTYNLRLTQEPWMTQVDPKGDPNWPKTPETWRSFYAYFTAPDPRTYADEAVTNKFLGHVTYTLTTSSGDPVPGMPVSLNGTARGHAPKCCSNYRNDYGFDEPKKTDANGRVSFVYMFTGNLLSPWIIHGITGGKAIDVSNNKTQAPESRPESILRTFCYSTCVASETPFSRVYNAETNPTGLKPRYGFEIDIIPEISGLGNVEISKDQIWLHVINPTLQKPAVVDPEDKFFATGYTNPASNSNPRKNIVGALAGVINGDLLGYPFSIAQEVWYGCTKPHPKLSYALPKDCTALPTKYHEIFKLLVIPRAASKKYVMGGFFLSNPAGSLLVLTPTAEKIA